jgi:polyphosphate kinase
MFESANHSATYMGSADLMPRNLDHRVEVVTPVEDPALQSELVATFDALLADTATSWELDGDGTWKRVRPRKDDERPRSAQAVLMRRARRRVSVARAR